MIWAIDGTPATDAEPPADELDAALDVELDAALEAAEDELELLEPQPAISRTAAATSAGNTSRRAALIVGFIYKINLLVLGMPCRAAPDRGGCLWYCLSRRPPAGAMATFGRASSQFVEAHRAADAPNN